ncbi:MAG: hypothetical protein K6F55_03060 [Eubacterium sp.]|nr:hypothetical protein [Eubacterium sp.]
MICNNCKNQVADGSMFCEFCGAKLINVTQQSQQQTGPMPGLGPQQGMQYQNRPQPAQSQQVPQPDQMKKGLNTPTLIAIIAGISIVVIVSVILIAFVIINKKVDEKLSEELSTVTTEAEVTTEEVTTAVTTTEATTVAEVTTEEPKPVPYAEEQGMEFVQPDFTCTVKSAPLFYDEDSNLITVDEVDVEKCETTKRIGNILVSKPDDNGIVTYYIEYYYDIDSFINDKKADNKWWYNVGNWSADLVDYYTGTIISSDNIIDGIADDDNLNVTKFEVDGQEVTIKCARYFQNVADTYVWDVQDVDGGKTYQYNETCKELLVVKAPESYDGLTFGLTLEDVDYDRYAKRVKEDKDEDSDDKEDNPPRKVFDDSKDGTKNTPDQYAFLRIKDHTKPVKAKRLANVLEVTSEKSYLAKFDWTDKFYNDPKFGGTPITNSEFLGGKWQGYMIWDKENKLNNYGEELFVGDLKFDGSDVSLTFDYQECKWGEDGEWEDKDEETTHNGTFASDGSIQFEIVDSNFSIQGFYTDGYSQYAIGTMVAQSGETATVFLVRP